MCCYGLPFVVALACVVVRAPAQGCMHGNAKCAILFFTALLVTWIPSSANRAFSVLHANEVSLPLEVLPLQDFWNAPSMPSPRSAPASASPLGCACCASFSSRRASADDTARLPRRRRPWQQQSRAPRAALAPGSGAS